MGDVQVSYDNVISNVFATFGYIPFAINTRAYITKTPIRPYVNLSFGGYVGVANLDRGSFYCRIGLGVDIRRWSIGLGYN